MIRTLCFVVLWLLFVVTSPVSAHPEYLKVFQKTHVTKENRDFRKLVRKAKCNVCHQGKEDRTNYNAYGEATLPHLDEETKKDKAKTAAALALVFDLPVNADDPEGATFGSRIEKGELPGGPLEASKLEPPATENADSETEEPDAETDETAGEDPTPSP